MVYYLLVVAPRTAPTPCASSALYERCGLSGAPLQRGDETIQDVLEVAGLKIFRAISAGAGLEDALPIQRTSALLLVAVPSEFTLEALRSFLDIEGDGLEAVRVAFRNEPRGRFSCPSLEGKSDPGSGGGFYTAILLCRSQAYADALYKANHGRLFSRDRSQDDSDKGPCCYLAFLEAIVYSQRVWELTRSKSDELKARKTSESEMPEAVIPSTAYEMPSCPVCIERIDVSGTGLVTHSHGWSAEQQDEGRPPTCFACAIIAANGGNVNPQPGSVVTRKTLGNPTLKCECCSKQDELWVCLICGHLGCGRYQDAHAKDHATENRHRFCYQLETGRIWDYASDVFVHRRLVQTAAMGRFELALPAPAVEEASSSSKVPVPGHEELLSMELDAILASQLDHQRSLYERQLADLQRLHSASLAELDSAKEQEQRRESSLYEELHGMEKQVKLQEKQLSAAQKSFAAEDERRNFAKELNQSLLQNRKDMAGVADAKTEEDDPLVLRLREKVALLREQISALDEG